MTANIAIIIFILFMIVEGIAHHKSRHGSRQGFWNMVFMFGAFAQGLSGMLVMGALCTGFIKKTIYLPTAFINNPRIVTIVCITLLVLLEIGAWIWAFNNNQTNNFEDWRAIYILLTLTFVVFIALFATNFHTGRIPYEALQ